MRDALRKCLNWRFAPALGAICVASVLAWVALGVRACADRTPDAGLAQTQPKPALQNPRTTAAPRPGESARAPTAPSVASNPPPEAVDTTDRIHALRQVRDELQLEALPRLLATDLSADPELAPTVIATVATLANAGDAATRAETARQLGQWLRSESARDAADARGNLAVLVEQLGELDSPAATAALADALESDRLPVHVATVAVQGLARFGDARVLRAAEHFRDRLAQLPAASGFEGELHDEAVHATELALAKLARVHRPG